MPAAAGRVPTTRRATVPAWSIEARVGTSSFGSGAPMAVQISENSAWTSATAGPRISTPVSRHGSTAEVPAQALPTHNPDTNATWPSTASILRWSRTSQASGRDTRGGLKARTSTPACTSAFRKRREVAPTPPSQS
jgi:hypothetical protein